MTKRCDWVIAYGGGMGDLSYGLECQRCGTVQKCVPPVAVSVWLAAATVFRQAHRKCKEKENG